MIQALRSVEIVRVRGTRRRAAADRAAVEEPLEVRLHGRPFAVVMRTPGADRELAAGFLLAERVIRAADDLGAIEHCADAAGAGGNVVDVTLSPGAGDRVERALRERRQVTTTSSCGLCGRLTIDSIRAEGAPLETADRLASSAIGTLPSRLRRAQAVFGETGGLHAAGLFALDGHLQSAAEDVGRHNAVDKVVGRLLMRDALPQSRALLFVSGRASFEIVQKAFLAGIPFVASVSAPSSLAIDLARETGITLVGFVRDAGFNVYSHADRVG
jgi:FdhD protein